MLFFLSIFIAQIFVPPTTPPPYQPGDGSYEKFTTEPKGPIFSEKYDRSSTPINEKGQIFMERRTEHSEDGDEKTAKI
ncbi:3613_t:CDS:2 [Acaulospora colombiana]|uniref:3613_t:CDS:1 n=1 Tax=Acaulospora colombiana TaxID=27376 RepID=A0ACA9K1N7_9GLOM|nr:3613_t:CDS:2 [Acaulospora colombiana]